jgi:hypothetical protein
MLELKTLEGLLEFYSWMLAAFVMIFVGMIAVFYQRKFNTKTYYRIYIIPVLMLLAVSSLNAVFGHDVYIEFVEMSAAVVSMVFTWHLYTIMMGVSQ